LQLVAFFTVVVRFGASFHRDFVQTDVLDRRPDDCQTTGLRGEDVNLIRALAHTTEEALDSIGGLNMPMHGGRELVKGQEVLFILSQAADCPWIALRVLGFEGGQLGQGLLLTRLLPDAHKFSLHIASLSSRDGIEHVALFMHQTALTRRGGKQLRNRSQQPIMPVADNQIEVGGSS
jgi:hypothetical protein